MNKKGNPENFIHNGQPKHWKTGEALVGDIKDFTTEISSECFTAVPTRTEFCARRGVDMKTLYNSLNLYFPEVKKEVEQLLSDCLATGALLGKYNATMTIFCLKNWFDWTDKQEQKIDMSAKVQRIEDYLAEYDD